MRKSSYSLESRNHYPLHHHQGWGNGEVGAVSDEADDRWAPRLRSHRRGVNDNGESVYKIAYEFSSTQRQRVRR